MKLDLTFQDIEGEETPIEPEPVQFGVIYEDNDIIVIDKPAPLVVHPAAGHRRNTWLMDSFTDILNWCQRIQKARNSAPPTQAHQGSW